MASRRARGGQYIVFCYLREGVDIARVGHGAVAAVQACELFGMHELVVAVAGGGQRGRLTQLPHVR